jgi:hypothetical protein
MKPIFTRILSVLLTATLYQTAAAQTYNIPVSVSSSVMGADGFNTCNNCIFNLSPGVVFTINTGGICNGCIFNGGTVDISSSSSVVWNNSSLNNTTFNNDTVLINAKNSIQNMNFNGDSVAINVPISFSQTGTTVSNSRVSSDTAFTPNTVQFTNSRYTFNGNASMTISNGLTSTNSSFYLNGKSSINSQSTTSLTGGSLVMADSTTFKASNALPITNTDITMGSDSKLTASTLTVIGGSITADSSIITSSNNLFLYGDTLTLSGISALSGAYFSSHNNGTTKGIINLSGSATISSNNADTLSYTTTIMAGTSVIKGASGYVYHDTLTQSGNSDFVVTNTLLMDSTDTHLDGNAIDSANILELDSSTYMQIGDGTAGTAHAWSNNQFEALVGSTLAIDAHTNYFHTGVSNFKGGTTTYALTATTGSCGGAGEHACVLNYVYGCATMNAGGAVSCVTLALADISLTAVPAGTNAVNLSWSDGQSATADHYLVQRSLNNGDWTTLATIAAGGYTAGDYQFEDPAAPAGTDNYRIARVDQDGAVLYSDISSVTIATAATTGAIGIGIYPNPATGHTFFITTPNTEQMTVSIFTVTGQLLSRQSLQGQVRYQLLLPSQLLPGNAVIVQAITTTAKQAFPLLLQ